MIPDQPNINKTEEPGAGLGLSPESSPRAAMMLEDAAAASLQVDVSSDAGPIDEVILSEEDLAGHSSQLAERGIDLGGLLGTIMAASSQPKPEPAAGKDEDPAVLLAKLAKSLGISPSELMKHLGPALKEMLSSQDAGPRRKPKKPAAKSKPKPKPTTKPAAKPKPKPQPTTKPSTKPSTKPKPKKASRSEPITQ